MKILNRLINLIITFLIIFSAQSAVIETAKAAPARKATYRSPVAKARYKPVAKRVAVKSVEIDLSEQRLYLLERGVRTQSFVISSGKASTPTPTGRFVIFNHFSNAWSRQHKLYMPYWMGLRTASGSYNGYGIHALPYWPDGRVEGVNHLGIPVSHGCIRLSREQAAPKR